MHIQKLRLKKGWSQQQLANASGLSARTIQRIESGQPASTETLKSIAAVFEVDFSSLNPEPPMTATPERPNEQQEAEAFEHVRKLRRFYLHVLRYLLVCGLLLAINLSAPHHSLWVLWPMAGWGLALLFQAANLFGLRSFLGPDWERREVEKRLGRSL
jgi:transcriptional regulator with XRE-family HTH domain